MPHVVAVGHSAVGSANLIAIFLAGCGKCLPRAGAPGWQIRAGCRRVRFLSLLTWANAGRDPHATVPDDPNPRPCGTGRAPPHPSRRPARPRSALIQSWGLDRDPCPGAGSRQMELPGLRRAHPARGPPRGQACPGQGGSDFDLDRLVALWRPCVKTEVRCPENTEVRCPLFSDVGVPWFMPQRPPPPLRARAPAWACARAGRLSFSPGAGSCRP